MRRRWRARLILSRKSGPRWLPLPAGRRIAIAVHRHLRGRKAGVIRRNFKMYNITGSQVLARLPCRWLRDGELRRAARFLIFDDDDGLTRIRAKSSADADEGHFGAAGRRRAALATKSGRLPSRDMP